MDEFSLRQKIQEDVKIAMRNKEALRLETLRMLLASIKQREIDSRVTAGNQLLTDTQIIAVIDKMIKQRQESIDQYQKGNREDLAAKEAAEIAILAIYLPSQLTENEITSLIQQAITETNATSVKDMAKVMSIIKNKAQGRADIGKISATIKQLLMIND